MVQNPKCSKEKGVLKVSDLKDRDEVELLLSVLSAESSSDANKEQSSPSSSNSLDHVASNGYSSQPLIEEPVEDFWRMGGDFFMEAMDLMNHYDQLRSYDDSSTSGDHDSIMTDDCLWSANGFLWS